MNSPDTQAAHWFGRREVGLSPSEEQEFQAWLSADPAHAVHYAEFDSTWDLLDRVAEIPSFQSKPKRPIAFRYWMPATLAAAAAVAVGIFLANPVVPETHYTEVTAANGFKRLELPDGSTIRLNGDTSVSVDLTGNERRIALHRGEAYFQVAHDPKRPFLVSAAGISVRAVGTAFNVSLNHRKLDVLVTEGKVRVEDIAQQRSVLTSASLTEDNHPLLTAGEHVSIDFKPAVQAQPLATVQPTAPPEIAQTLAWQVRTLDFDDKPLAEVVKEFNRHNRHQLVIDDPALANRAFGGTFRADNYEALVELLESRFNVTAERVGDRTVLRLAR